MVKVAQWNPGLAEHIVESVWNLSQTVREEHCVW